MQEDSKSQDSTTSTLTSKYRHLHICIHCSKEFSNGHALAGHQNAHRFYKNFSTSWKMNPQAGIVGLFIDHHPVASHYRPTPVAPVGGVAYGLQGHPPPPPPPPLAAPSGFDGCVARRPRGVLKVRPRDHGASSYHPYERGVMMSVVASQRENGSDFDSQRTLTNPLIGVSRKDDGDDGGDDDGFEENEELDLELRLGFNCKKGSGAGAGAGGGRGSFPS